MLRRKTRCHRTRPSGPARLVLGPEWLLAIVVLSWEIVPRTTMVDLGPAWHQQKWHLSPRTMPYTMSIVVLGPQWSIFWHAISVLSPQGTEKYQWQLSPRTRVARKTRAISVLGPQGTEICQWQLSPSTRAARKTGAISVLGPEWLKYTWHLSPRTTRDGNMSMTAQS